MLIFFVTFLSIPIVLFKLIFRMRQIKIFILLLLTFITVTINSYSQSSQQSMYVPLTTAVPFLLIAPDARGGALGDLGAATTPDAYSLYWNPAKYAFIDKDFGFGISYVPWLRGLVNDIGLSSVVGFKKFGDKQAVAMSLRYFSMGEVTFTDDVGNSLGDYKPNEFAIDATYSRKFSRVISGAVAGRFIYSNLIPGGGAQATYNTKPGISVAADVSLYGHKELEIKGLTSSFLDFGFNISNIGSKISYSSTSSTSSFIPTNLRVGVNYSMDIDEYNRLSFAFDVNKLLVPTPPIYATDSSGNLIVVNGEYVIEDGMNPDVPPIQGMIQSFYDAPNGFKEEMAEINLCVATEYWYNKLFAIRAGYFYESKNKGGRQFFTLGAGLRYNVFGLDFSYLIPVQSNNPLQNTMQFTLLFNFNGPDGKAKSGDKGTN
jgi:hypothetical protein